jgi:hypothetical protein
MSDVSRDYVKLVLAVGEHDSDYVDAYYGPSEIRDEVTREKLSLDSILTKAREVRASVGTGTGSDELDRLRIEYLGRQLDALITRVEMLGGRRLSFDEESRELYDAEAPHYSADYFEAILSDLEKEIGGSGPLGERIEAFRLRHAIPREKLDAVFGAAIDAGRARTSEHLDLPSGESFTVEYVNDKAWSGYNWYQGGFRSLIQVNTDLPIYIDRAVDLACHEGYPGHHVYNVLLEKALVRDRGWIEFSVYPLFSPQSLIAEGSANYGIDVAFSPEERIEFEESVLFPLAGLEKGTAARYYRVHDLAMKLAYAGNEAARGYLDGKFGADEAVEWLTRYALMAPERARQRVRFFDKYRSYVINYNLGRDLVAEYVERNGGTPDNPQKRWKVFGDLLASPRLPSSLRD